MPYIKEDQRQKLIKKDSDGKLTSSQIPQDAGELNYFITKLIHWYLEDKGECYQAYNDILGALEGAKLEIYRRRTSSYEDHKCRLNGDV